jgi:hypothetical protein
MLCRKAFTVFHGPLDFFLRRSPLSQSLYSIWVCGTRATSGKGETSETIAFMALVALVASIASIAFIASAR